MDSLLVRSLFRQLATSRHSNCLHLQSAAAPQSTSQSQQRRRYVSRRTREKNERGSQWQQRIDAFPKDMSTQLVEYPKVTSRDLRNRRERPKRVKMLARDFVEGQGVHQASRLVTD